ncbi:hypothetical protein [Roseospira goensis]|uniref:Antifreeze protein n=1 Tax=Roseospira goensis TaxID=391922 RepID=A0A7W6S315_9PROT|nr:hypothetical protein [Roseospira goensis]MBB4287277.1 hypothetical protein [Roseospira goensis]
MTASRRTAGAGLALLALLAGAAAPVPALAQAPPPAGGTGQPLPLVPPDWRAPEPESEPEPDSEFEPPPAAVPPALTPPDTTAPAAPPREAAPAVRPAAPPGAMPSLDPPREIAPPPGGLTQEERALPPPGPPTKPPVPARAAPPAPVGDATGVLPARPGGLPQDLWAGTSGARVRDLVAALPLTVPSPIVADLRRRLLLTVQTAPPGLSARALLALRVGRLAALGGPADDLVALAEPLGPGAEADRARLRALAIEGRDDRVCALARGVGAGYVDPVWQQAAIHCDLLDGARDRALLGLALLREMGGGAAAGDERGSDGAFMLLAERLAGLDSPAPDSFAGASALAYRLLRALPDLDAPADALRAGEPWTARALALGGGGPPSLIAAAAERAAAVGAVSIDDLATAWRDLDVDPRDLETPVSRVVLGGTALDRALAYAILARETDPERLAEGLLHPLETSRTKTPVLYPLHAALYAPLIRAIPVEPAVPAFLGAAAGRALYAAGSIEAGRTWLRRLGQQGRAGDADAEDAAALLWPIARVADAALGDPLPGERLVLWRQARAARLGDGAEARRVLDRDHVVLLNVLEALGAPVQAVHWLPIKSSRVFVEAVAVDGGFTDADRLAALERAVGDGRPGAALALALRALGPEGPAGASLETLQAVIGALRALDLTADARRVALEALLARGI